MSSGVITSTPSYSRPFASTGVTTAIRSAPARLACSSLADSPSLVDAGQMTPTVPLTSASSARREGYRRGHLPSINQGRADDPDGTPHVGEQRPHDVDHGVVDVGVLRSGV